jgi:hypothetical protein
MAKKIVRVDVSEHSTDKVAFAIVFENSNPIYLSQSELCAITAFQNALDNDSDCYAKALKRCDEEDNDNFMQVRCDVVVEVMNG